MSLQENEWTRAAKAAVPGAKFGDPATCAWLKQQRRDHQGDAAVVKKITAALKYMGCDGKPRGAGGRY